MFVMNQGDPKPKGIDKELNVEDKETDKYVKGIVGEKEGDKDEYEVYQGNVREPKGIDDEVNVGKRKVDKDDVRNSKDTVYKVSDILKEEWNIGWRN